MLKPLSNQRQHQPVLLEPKINMRGFARPALTCLQFAPRGFQIWGSCQGLVVEQGMVDLLAKACAHGGIKAIGVKTTVITSAIFAVGLFNPKKKKHESLVVFCQEV